MKKETEARVALVKHISDQRISKAKKAKQWDENLQRFAREREIQQHKTVTTPELEPEDKQMIDPDSLFRIYLAVEQNPDEAHTSITYNPSRMAGLYAPIIDALRRYRIIVPSGESPQVQTNMELWKKRQVEILLFISRRLAKFKQQFSEASNGRGVRYAKIVVNELFEPFVIELTLNIYDTPDTAEFTVKISYNDVPQCGV